MIKILEKVKPVTAYHGTTDVFLREILKKGMLPNPQNRVWDEDPNANAMKISLESLYGTYWTTNLMTATSATRDATKKFNGNAIIVIASIVPESGVADEDHVTAFFKSSLMMGIENQFGNVQYTWPHDLGRIWGAMKGNRDLFFLILEDASKNMHKELSKSPEIKPVPYDLISKAVLTYLKRQAIFSVRENNSSDIFEWRRAFSDNYTSFSSKDRKDKYENLSDVPLPIEMFGYNKREIESRFKEVEDELTRYYREAMVSKIRSGGIMGGNVRILEPVTYSGRNRILSIVRFQEVEITNRLSGEPMRTDAVEIVYGKLPNKFVEDYEKRIGEILWYEDFV